MPTARIDKDRPAQHKESGTRKERTARLAKHIALPNEISLRHTIGQVESSQYEGTAGTVK